MELPQSLRATVFRRRRNPASAMPIPPRRPGRELSAPGFSPAGAPLPAVSILRRVGCGHRSSGKDPPERCLPAVSGVPSRIRRTLRPAFPILPGPQEAETECPDCFRPLSGSVPPTPARRQIPPAAKRGRRRHSAAPGLSERLPAPVSLPPNPTAPAAGRPP